MSLLTVPCLPRIDKFSSGNVSNRQWLVGQTLSMKFPLNLFKRLNFLKVSGVEILTPEFITSSNNSSLLCFPECWQPWGFEVQGLLSQLHGREGLSVLPGSGVHSQAVVANGQVIRVPYFLLGSGNHLEVTGSKPLAIRKLLWFLMDGCYVQASSLYLRRLMVLLD